MAEVCIINKCDTADESDIKKLESNIKEVNPKVEIVRANSPITVENPDKIKGRKVLVIEDGPTMTHGDMSFSAGKLAAEKYGASEIVDPRKHARGSIKETFDKYPHLKDVLLAMGYSDKQLRDLEKTIEKPNCNLVVSGTPINITRILDIDKPLVNVKHEFGLQGVRKLEELLSNFY